MIGYWDMDNGGGTGTDKTSGSYMMALYAKLVDTSKAGSVERIGEIILTCSDASSPVPPATPDGDPAYTCIGFWDVDNGGGVGTNGTRGAFMAGLYVRRESAPQLPPFYISDVFLTASDDSFPALPAIPAGSSYHLLGHWDVDNGGAIGTDGSKGANQAGLFIQRRRSS